MDTVEALENMRLVTERDTDTIVVHADTDGTPIATNLQGNLDRGGAAMFQGVIHQIVKRLFYSKGVGLDPRQMFRRLDRNRRSTLANTGIQPFQDSVYTFKKIDRLKVETDFSGLQLR